MTRMFLVLALATAVSMAGTAMAQGPRGSSGFKKKGEAPAAEDEGVKKLESELNKLRTQLYELEQLVSKAKAAAAKEGQGKARGGPGDSLEKKEGKRPGGSFQKKEGKKAGDDLESKEPKNFGPEGGPENKDRKAFGPGGSLEKKDRKDFGPGGDFGKKERKGFGPPLGGPARPASVEERLDRILRELEAIRRDLKQ
jgi:hypothetical protein